MGRGCGRRREDEIHEQEIGGPREMRREEQRPRTRGGERGEERGRGVGEEGISRRARMRCRSLREEDQERHGGRSDSQGEGRRRERSRRELGIGEE